MTTNMTTAKKTNAMRLAKRTNRARRMTAGEREARQRLGNAQVDEIQTLVQELGTKGVSVSAIVEEVRTRFPDVLVALTIFRPTSGGATQGVRFSPSTSLRFDLPTATR